MSMFSPRSKQRHLTMPDETRDIDVLIGTDVISEGRTSRTATTSSTTTSTGTRCGSSSGSAASTVSVDERGHPARQLLARHLLDEYINLKERVENRMVIADLAGSADDNVLNPEDSDAAFRKEQLRKLQSENIELEDVRAGVSITDPRAQRLPDGPARLHGRVRRHRNSPTGLHAVIPADPSKGLLPGDLRAEERQRRP
jgi:hypothetical protein